MALIGATIIEQIINFLRSKGLNDFGIAGVLGNAFAESGLNPRNLQNTYEKKLGMTDQQYTDAVDNGTYTNFVYDKAGYGLFQLTYWSRKQNFLNSVKEKKTSIGDPEVQLEFFYQELTVSYPAVLNVLKTATSVRQASNAMLINYERPASQGKDATEEQRLKAQNDRAAYSQNYYDKYLATKEGGSSMKYTEKNKPLQCMMTNSTCYKQTRKMEVKGVLWHSTGANNPNLRRYVQPSANDPNYAQLMQLLGKNTGGNDWNHVERQAGLNCWIGKLADGTVTTVQTMPWNYRPWGCASGKNGSCNNGWIQFEICEDALNDRDYFNKVYKEACEITAYLCKMFNIDPYGTVKYGKINVPTILCHQDSYQLGLGSNHGDVLHWFPKFGKSMETARNDVAALLGSAPASKPTSVSYQAKVIAQDGLNCRDNPNGSIIMTYPAGTLLSISQENNGWGFTGTGWVSLDWVEKIKTDNGMEDEDMDMTRFKELFSEMRKDLQDNDSGAYSKEAREWALATGLIAGNGTQINGEPNCMWQDFLTREQLVTVLYRFAQMMGKA